MLNSIRNNRSLQKVILWTILAAVIMAIVSFIPPGYDYAHYFGLHAVEISALPWTDGLLYFLTWPIVIALTVVAQFIAVDQRGGSLWTSLLAILSLPTIWVMLIGQLDGVALFGLTLMSWSVPVLLIERRQVRRRSWWVALIVFAVATSLSAWFIHVWQGANYFSFGVGGMQIGTMLRTSPLIGVAMAPLLLWVVPIVLIKPQITAFALLARKNWTIVTAGWAALSILIWGSWLLNLALRVSPDMKSAQPQDISLFPWSLVWAIPMLWLGRRDQDMLMAAGSFVSPSLHPYHYAVLMPSLARLPIGLRLLCWLFSFWPLAANYFGPKFWLTGNLFPLTLWLCLWLLRRRGRIQAYSG